MTAEQLEPSQKADLPPGLEIFVERAIIAAKERIWRSLLLDPKDYPNPGLIESLAQALEQPEMLDIHRTLFGSLPSDKSEPPTQP